MSLLNKLMQTMRSDRFRNTALKRTIQVVMVASLVQLILFNKTPKFNHGQEVDEGEPE